MEYLMKKHQTAKYKKRHKKELANRKAKRLATQQPEWVCPHCGNNKVIGHSMYCPDNPMNKGKPDAEPISPARRAFQDV